MGITFRDKEGKGLIIKCTRGNKRYSMLVVLTGDILATLEEGDIVKLWYTLNSMDKEEGQLLILAGGKLSVHLHEGYLTARYRFTFYSHTAPLQQGKKADELARYDIDSYQVALLQVYLNKVVNTMIDDVTKINLEVN